MPPSVSRKSTQMPSKKSLHLCESCIGFITDWLRLPPHRDEFWVSKVKVSVLKRIAPVLAKELYRLIQSITGTDSYIISNTIHMRLLAEEKRLAKENPSTQSLELFAWHTTFNVILSQRGEADINHIKACIEDSGMIRSSSDCELWIGHSIWMLWTELLNIHLEHLKYKETTGAGPAFGMRTYTSRPRTQVSTHTSVESLRS
jgi:hypothetical protein